MGILKNIARVFRGDHTKPVDRKRMRINFRDIRKGDRLWYKQVAWVGKNKDVITVRLEGEKIEFSASGGIEVTIEREV